jgi:hypothetical protein
MGIGKSKYFKNAASMGNGKCNAIGRLDQANLARAGSCWYAFQTRNPCPEIYGHNNLLTAQIELEHRDVCLHAAIIL